MITLVFMTMTIYWTAGSPRARDSAELGMMALCAQWVAETPSLVFKYAFCATVCPCCLDKKDALNSASDIVGGAPECHIDMAVR